jgi:hypothetical protein
MRRVLFCLVLSLSAHAATYHVAKNGSDASPGSSARPFLTIARAVRDLKAGDGVYVHAGTYREEVTIWRRKGTQAAPIAVHRFGNDTVAIDGSITLTDVAWLSLSGFEIRNSHDRALLLWNTRHVSVRWNTIHDVRRGGILASGDGRGRSSDVIIEGNTIRNTALENLPRTAREAWPQALAVVDTERAVIRGNHVYENYGEGIDAIRSSHVTIAENIVHSNYSVNVYLDNARDTIVDRNLVFNTPDARFYRFGRPAYGIAAANEKYRYQTPLRNLTITNNIVLWCRAAFTYGDYQAGGGLHGTLIAHNTFYASTEALLRIEGTTHDTTIVADNLLLATSGRAYTTRVPPGVTFRNNAWFGGDARTIAAGIGDVRADPRVVNAGGGSATDYQLTRDSPLIDQATPMGIRADYFGHARDDGKPDIGAHESVSRR